MKRCFTISRGCTNGGQHIRAFVIHSWTAFLNDW